MSSLFLNSELSFTERTILRLLRQGEIPTHIGFIMDGNRRYARVREMEHLVGHIRGLEKLSKTLSWCRDLGVHKVTIYAFSIENFKRPAQEVDALMDLFCGQFVKMLGEISKFKTFQICVRFYGRLNLLPEELQETIAKVVARTAKNNRFYLNIALAYTAREEIGSAMTSIKSRVKDDQLSEEEITEETLNNSMYSAGLEEPEVLFRTSGEIRLSDFLLWQTGFSSILFVKEMWPEFSVWSLFVGILHYQVHSSYIIWAKERYGAEMRLLEQKQPKQESNKLKKKKAFSIKSNDIDVDSIHNSNGFCGALNGKKSDDDACLHRRLSETGKVGKSKLTHPRSELLFAAFLLLILLCAVTSGLFAAT